MKQIQLSVEKAKALFGKNTELDEILKENFTEEELGLKKPLPMCYGDLIEINGFYVSSAADIESIRGLYADKTAYNVFVTEFQAKSALAYAQLTQLMKAYNGDWVPNWKNDTQPKYVITREGDYLEQWRYYSLYCFLAFPTEELRDEFMKNFEPLIKTFYQI